MNAGEKLKTKAAMASRGTVQTEQQSKILSGNQLLRLIRRADITNGAAEWLSGELSSHTQVPGV